MILGLETGSGTLRSLGIMLGNGRFFRKEAVCISKVFNSQSAVSRNKNTSTEKKIIIPERIERKPTDILKALSSTHQQDPTGFHYKFIDDPFLYPYKLVDQRVYALCKESGKKSARWVFNEHPGLFKRQSSDPPIKAFIPKSESGGELTEETLLRDIEERKVESAIATYNALKSKGEDLKASTKQSLLELTCFYNSEEKPNSDMESKWYLGYLGRAISTDKEKPWNDEGFAKRLFGEMDPDCPLANSAMIQGMFRYKSSTKALELYEQARAKGIIFSVGVYNSILSEAHKIEKRKENIKNLVLGVLQEMSDAKVTPNIGTLNSALLALSFTPYWSLARILVNEFSSIGIRPSLGTYAYLFTIIGRISKTLEGEVLSEMDLIEELFTQIEDSEHEILHPSDLRFFSESMRLFSEVLNSSDLALKLWNMLERNNNRNFIVRALDEYIFFTQLCTVVFKQKPIEFAMDLYRRLVYTRFGPRSDLLTLIIKTVRENHSADYLADVWKDFQRLGFSKNRPMLLRMFEGMNEFKDETSLNVFYEMAISCLGKMDEFMSGDEHLIPYMISVFLTKEDEMRLSKTIDIARDKAMVLKDMSDEVVERLVEYAISKGNAPLIVRSLWIANEQDHVSLDKLVEKALPFLRGEDEAWAKGLIATEIKSDGMKSEEWDF